MRCGSASEVPPAVTDIEGLKPFNCHRSENMPLQSPHSGAAVAGQLCPAAGCVAGEEKNPVRNSESVPS